MKFPSTTAFTRSRSRRAFTITEMMISSAMFMVIIGGVIYSHIVGAKMYQLTKSKLGASDQSRAAISLLISEIRSAKKVDVGTAYLTNSVWKLMECTEGALQQGTAIQLYPTTNYTTPYIIYYLDSSTAKLQRTVNGSNTLDIVAECITNAFPFTSEDYRGNVTTENQNNRIIGLNLQFYQIQFPIVHIGGGQYYDFYQLRTKIAKRTLE